ncbi:MAG: retropepsin-like domain-containing protein [Lachnospiraceae bacterium]|nr:retropepsin-like domain-containing protein [Lachnospiraceae bacterium]
MAEVKLNENGFAFIRVFIKDKSEPTMLPLSFKVDSGANCTTISRSVLTKLGYDDDWIKTGKLLEGNERPTVATGEAIGDFHKPLPTDSGANSAALRQTSSTCHQHASSVFLVRRYLHSKSARKGLWKAPIDNCYLVTLPEIHIGGCVGYNWPVRVSLNEKVQFRLLFGTDSMRFFNFEFNYEHNVCKFSLIPGKRQLSFNQKEQSIHAVDEMA